VDISNEADKIARNHKIEVLSVIKNWESPDIFIVYLLAVSKIGSSDRF
jgi:hypothetical protein